MSGSQDPRAGILGSWDPGILGSWYPGSQTPRIQVWFHLPFWPFWPVMAVRPLWPLWAITAVTAVTAVSGENQHRIHTWLSELVGMSRITAALAAVIRDIPSSAESQVWFHLPF